MAGRHTFTAGLWLVSLVLLAAVVVRGIPWLLPRLFPGPEPALSEEAAAGEPTGSVTPELAQEVLHTTLTTLGPPGENAGSVIRLPRGRSARDLERALREDERLQGSEVYVTQVDELLYRVRVFLGGDVVLQRDLRPWLPERPVVSEADPPEVGFVVVFGESMPPRVKEVGRWNAPLAVGLPPFAPHSVRSARDATWASKGIVVLVDPGSGLAPQLLACPDASGVLLDRDPPSGMDLEKWLEPLSEGNLFLLDGRTTQVKALRDAARKSGVSYVRRAVHLEPADPNSAVLARNLTIRRGYGLVSVDGDDEGLAALEELIQSTRDDGYLLRFPVEVASEHGALEPGP